jgi:hypothetical protein
MSFYHRGSPQRMSPGSRLPASVRKVASRACGLRLRGGDRELARFARSHCCLPSSRAGDFEKAVAPLRDGMGPKDISEMDFARLRPAHRPSVNPSASIRLGRPTKVCRQRAPGFGRLERRFGTLPYLMLGSIDVFMDRRADGSNPRLSRTALREAWLWLSRSRRGRVWSSARVVTR